MKAKFPLHLLLITSEFYPDNKRGGAVFARNFFEVIKDLVFKVNVVTLRRSSGLDHPDVLMLKVVKCKSSTGFVSRLRYLLILPLYLLFSFRALSKLKPHFIFSNGIYDSIVPMIARKPYAVILHDDSLLKVGKIVRILGPILLKKASFIICPSKAIAKIMNTYMKRRKKIFVINNFLSLQKIKSIRDADLNGVFKKYAELKNKKLILFVGTFSPHKGVHALIRAMSKVREKIPEACLIIVGPGSEHKRRTPQQGIIYAGIVSDAELASLYVAADVFILPSVGLEGFGIVLLEAMAAGKPIIAGNLPSFREVAGDAAIYVDGRDTNSIYSALVRILEDDKLAYQLSLRSYKRSKIFSKKRVRLQCLKMLTYMLKTLKNKS
ncbi:MAG: glycosyltransferase [Nitrososphaeria archaeon]